MKVRLVFICLLLIILNFSCNRINLNVNINSIKLPVKFTNLDSLEFNTQDPLKLKNSIASEVPNLSEIISYQFNYCLDIGKADDDSSYTHLIMFTQDPYFQRVHRAIKTQLYPEIPKFNREIHNAFKRLKYHEITRIYPQQILYMNSAFSSSIFSTESQIGISLERYLSDSNQVIKELPSDPFFEWVKAKFKKNYLVRDVMLGWITAHVIDVDHGNLAEKMISYGKALLLTNATLPYYKEATILRYSDKQMKWAEDNEWNLWDYLVREKLLYTNSERDHTNLLNDAPYTAGLPEQGPDRLGQYLGYKMVMDYYKAHSKMALKELIRLPYTEFIKEFKVK